MSYVSDVVVVGVISQYDVNVWLYDQHMRCVFARAHSIRTGSISNSEASKNVRDSIFLFLFVCLFLANLFNSLCHFCR